MAYDNTNRGALFKAEKEGNESRPDYSGNLNVDGKEFFLDAWIKTSKAGQKYMSLSVKPKMARHQGGTKNPPAQKDESFQDDDLIPWS